jgi:hypothetical protein
MDFEGQSTRFSRCSAIAAGALAADFIKTKVLFGADGSATA